MHHTHQPHAGQRMLRYALVACWMLALVSGAAVYAAAQPLATSFDDPTLPPEPIVESVKHSVGILIPLPVFLGSIGGTVLLTWKAAKYDTARDTKIDTLEREIVELRTKVDQATRTGDPT